MTDNSCPCCGLDTLDAELPGTGAALRIELAHPAVGKGHGLLQRPEAVVDTWQGHTFCTGSISMISQIYLDLRPKITFEIV